MHRSVLLAIRATICFHMLQINRILPLLLPHEMQLHAIPAYMESVEVLTAVSFHLVVCYLLHGLSPIGDEKHHLLALSTWAADSSDVGHRNRDVLALPLIPCDKASAAVDPEVQTFCR